MAILKPEHKALERFWYNKLKEEGFIDIEDTLIPERPLLAWHSFRFAQVNPLKREINELYASKALELIHTYQFENELEKKIWELHAGGYSKREIALILKDQYKKCKREKIGLIIMKIRVEIK